MFNKKLTAELDATKLELSKSSDFVKSLQGHMPTIMFTPEGNILEASEMFLQAVGYAADQVKGKLHRMFCTSKFYEQNASFWAELEQGHVKSGCCNRLSKGGGD